MNPVGTRDIITPKQSTTKPCAYVQVINTHWGREKMAARQPFQTHFLEWNCDVFFIKISLIFVPKGSISSIPSLVQIMAWRRPGDKPLSEPIWLDYGRIYASFGFNELRPVMEEFIVTMHEGACKQEDQSRSRYADGLEVLFAQARVHCDKKPQKIGLHHDYNMTFFNFTPWMLVPYI